MKQLKKNFLRNAALAACAGVALFAVAAVRDEARGGGGRGAQPQAQKRARREVPQRQAQALEQAQREGVGVAWGERMQSPTSVRGRDLGEARSFSGGRKLQVVRGAAKEANAIAVMDNLAPLFGIADAQEEFEVKRVDTDKLGFNHVRLTQRYQGLRVIGGEIIVHFNGEDAAYEVNGQYAPGLEMDVRPGMDADAAAKVAQDDLAAMGYEAAGAAKAPELVIYARDGAEPRLAYEMTLKGLLQGQRGLPAPWRYCVDAQTGGILMKYNDAKNIAAPTEDGEPVTIRGSILEGEGGHEVQVGGWRENGYYYLHNPDNCWTVWDTFNSWYPIFGDYAYRLTDDWGTSDRAEMSVAYNMDIVQRYFREVHGRNSVDGNGMMVNAYVHYGEDYVNAGWSSSEEIFIVGDGDGETADCLGVLDVMGHELTHAVTSFTADLEYQDEPGALNESFSDIFGANIEFYAQPDNRDAYPNASPATADWLMGEDCWISSRALRDMRNPRNTEVVGAGNEQPSRYEGEYWHTDISDNGGVHINSGVQNFFYYLLCDGGAGDNDGLPYDVQGIGVTRAEQVAYRVLTVYCTPYTDYAAVREAWFSAVRDLYPDCLASVRHAWDAVLGPQDPPSFRTPDDLPDGRVGSPYVTTFSATSPSPIYMWYHVGGALPPDLAFSPNGMLSGFPVQAGLYTFLIAVEANNGLISTNEFRLMIRTPLEVPFEEHFEGEMEGPQTGWMQESVQGTYLWSIREGSPSMRPSVSRDGTGNAYLGNWNENGTKTRPDHVARLISPMMVFGDAPRGARLTFYMYMEGMNNGMWQDELRVYTKGNWFDPWGQPIATFTTSTQGWMKQTVDLPVPVPGQQMYIAFEGSALGGYGVCIDGICIEDPVPPLAILTPPVLPVATVGTNYVALAQLESEGGWSDDPDEYTYAIIEGALPAGFALTPEGVFTGCSHQVETSTVVVQVTDSHGNTAAKAFIFTVELPRAPVFAEDFEVLEQYSGLPAGWSWQYEAGSAKWQIVTSRTLPSQWAPPTTAHSGLRFALFFASPSQGTELRTKLVSPQIDLSQAPNNTRLNFWHFMQKWIGQDELRIYYRTGPNEAWVPLATYTSDVTEWTERSVQLPNLSATYQVAFEGRARNAAGYGVAIDAVTITDDAAAPIITTLRGLPGGFSGFPYHTQLQAVGGAPDYAWGLVDGVLPAGLDLDAGDGTIAGTPTETGTFAFRVFVEGSDGLASTNSFTMRILAPGQIPFVETFENPGLPDGWTLERVQGFADWTFCPGTWSTYPGATPKKAPDASSKTNACFWTQSSGDNVARLITPPINLSGTTNTVLTFQLCMAPYLRVNEQLKVRYRTSAQENWITLTNYVYAVPTWTPQTIELPNPSETYYIAFEGRVQNPKGYGVCVGSMYAFGDPIVTEYTFTDWQRDNFTEGELDDPNISGPDANPTGDGLSNLLKYAMGLDPNEWENNTWVWGGLTNVVSHAEVPDGSYLYLKYRRALSVKDVEFTVLGTPSLTPPDLNWSPIDILELEPWTPGTEPDVWSWVHNIHLTPSTDAPQRFLRLRVELK
ncbi:MAG: M4 family metallopeptidase [Kiritimatiellaeota bacterium]|nr:M4 family metallopeptidase [Kiritimatiellota bacterium]